jgi:type IV secretion system protein VirB11
VVPAPTFAIRKKAVAIFTLQDYVSGGVMTPHQCRVIEQAISDHRNILVIGGTGSGKTTLVNAIIHQMVIDNPSERIFIIEDTGEIQCSAENYVQYHTTSDVNMTALLKTTLRMRPDRILVGEVRGPEALDLLMAWNTGHEGGAATLHANTAIAGLSRLAMLISMNPESPKPIEPLIGEAVHVVVHIARTPNGRLVQEILEVSGYRDGAYLTQSL